MGRTWRLQAVALALSRARRIRSPSATKSSALPLHSRPQPRQRQRARAIDATIVGRTVGSNSTDCALRRCDPGVFGMVCFHIAFWPVWCFRW